LKRLLCFHEYHGHCIDKWLEKDKKCPMCLREVDIDALIASKF
jgi:hypothetical protein